MTELLSQEEKAILLRQLHQGPKILVLPNAWDAASARIFEEAGFGAIASTSAGIAFALGYPDGQVIPRDEMLFMLRRIVATVRVPVTADIEAGYGADSVDEVLTTVRGVLAAGAVGINLEDLAEGGAALADADLQSEKIRTIRALADTHGIPLVINARTDIFSLASISAEEKLDRAIRRGNRYLDSGADCVFVPFVKDEPTISALAQGIRGPLNILALPGSPSVSELEALGVRRVSVGGGPARAAMSFTRSVAAELHDLGTYTRFTEQVMTYAEANQLFTKNNF
ncbi:2-methylisocitrate lyase [Capsulimonas corticalis]|uniref:2-methylisocitrate lyase n=1 Tax=Capsulimonas corticalis TaxID=2219043 RepID=A0A402CZN6_9BACT|nr:isocitrate lyase/phosphoenolpyruvate mutase family protein [Capsulimonas corticalis]BDI33898.1 2-methylisocitrate lyase [Capsulimonas corticalis]